MTKSEYARHRGCDEKAVRKAINESRITALPQPNGREMIDPDVADIQWARNTRARGDSGRAGAVSVAEGVDPASTTENAATAPIATAKDEYNVLRTERERLALDRERRENDEEKGRLVDRADVERSTFDAFRALRDAVMSAPQRAAAKVVGMGDARDIERVFMSELRGAFEIAESRLLERLPKKGNT